MRRKCSFNRGEDRDVKWIEREREREREERELIERENFGERWKWC